MTLRHLFILVALAALPVPAVAQTFLDVTSVTSGTSGSFTGLIGSCVVNGSIASNTASALTFNDTSFGSAWGASTTDGSSQQFSYANIFSPNIATTDRIGYSRAANATTNGTTSRVTVTFSGAGVTGLSFHIANLDLTTIDFSPTPGVTVSLTRGNGGGIDGINGDGLGVTGTTLRDRNNTTFATQDPSATPLTTGSRSAYGSVAINSASPITTLTFDFTTVSTSATVDNGNFTFSATPVPEPATVLAVAAVGLAGWWRLRRATA